MAGGGEDKRIVSGFAEIAGVEAGLGWAGLGWAGLGGLGWLGWCGNVVRSWLMMEETPPISPGR